MRLLLASKSPRRRQLIAALGYEVQCVDVDVDETVTLPLPVEAMAQHLACRKAAAYTGAIAQGDVLVAADTVVAHGGMALGKPASRDEAVAMLKSLSADSHQVHTGVCLRSADRTIAFTETTKVHFKPLTPDEINHYVDRYKPYDKAGAYGIQEWIGMIGITAIEGCYYNVMGLPTARLWHELGQFSPQPTEKD